MDIKHKNDRPLGNVKSKDGIKISNLFSFVVQTKSSVILSYSLKLAIYLYFDQNK